MKNSRHGLSIGIERLNDQYLLTLKAIGQLTHDDYKIINPMVDSALDGVRGPNVNVLFDGTELEGWQARAAWDDFKLGLKHGGQFNKIAIYGNQRWQAMAAKVGTWFVAAEVRFFAELEPAYEWLN